jgi:hypothetical protein
MATLDQFREGFRGVRGNRFRVTGNFPSTISTPTAQTFEFYCKASAVPGSSIGMIPVGYKGRPVKFSGERVYQDWAIAIYDSSTEELRAKFEAWIDLMDSRNAHEINYNISDDAWGIDYMDMLGNLSQSNSSYVKKIRLRNAFPIDISAMEMSYDVNDTFAEFSVTVAYDYWEYI